MKKFARWIGIGLIWFVMVLGFMGALGMPAFNDWYAKFYSNAITQRNELYGQVEILKLDFQKVYDMRNAEIINSEEPVIVLKNDRLTLKVSFNKNRTDITEIEEEREVPENTWIIATLLIALPLYICYSIGKCVATNTYKRKELTDESYQE